MNPKFQLMLQQVIQAFQGDNFDLASSTLNKSLQVDVSSSEAIFDLGIAYAEANKFAEALTIFYCLKSYKNSDARIPYNMGIIHSLEGKYELALVAYDLTLKLQPDYVEALINKGAIHNEMKDYALALEVLDRAINLSENYYEAYSNKGATLHELKRYDEAITQYDKALSLKPDDHEARINKGATLHELKRYDEAITQYDKALSLKPDDHEAWINKGATLYKLKRYEEAITHCDKALSLKPDNHVAWSSKGMSLHELKCYEEAIAHYERALSLRPDYPEGWSNKGVTLHELKRYEEAIVHYEKALSLKPDADWVYGDLVYTKMKICSWSGLVDLLDIICRKVMAGEKAAQPFPLLALSDDASLHKQCSEIYAQNRYPSNLTLGSIPKLSKKEKIRIAYFSPDFRSHPVSFLTSELFEIHDRSKFEVFAFSLQKVPIDDEINIRLRKAFDRFVDVDNMSDQEIAQLARELELDIAIDLAGPTQYSRTRIFSYRAAPIQVNWLGYAGTIGANFIDYIVADKTIIPDQSQQFYSEKVVTLPDTYIVDDSKRIPSSREFTKKECGLPKNTFIFCCFNNDYKFNPQVLDSWSRILWAAKNSVLWIPENNERFSANIKFEFERRGISSNRVIFAQRVESMADHLTRYALADLFLDTYPYNAHTTTLDALKAGVPVLTLMGGSFASRVAASLLNAIGLPELITNTQEEYESLAIELALNHQKLADIKLRLANNRLTAPLFDTPLFTKNLEAAYIAMYERYQADLEPEHISIA
ncbi:tetratricopeptide repeat protein [Polynucleobacter sp. 73C-SIWE]|uniref:tetratricopeptide repeat protein n=1 Tax=Polynucleobacter sp. 73C-SIWE TaxID=2689098 RepID=UPI001C0C4E9C|nr:tetratricopeptide repeat protein [Polynucleobacter sp. 73C-SIWE]MBU3579232.1 tetratricopeptide repeat protein [Polynucleobacter sp. 73C-SIWE]